jgi:hypothetical protein
MNALADNVFQMTNAELIGLAKNRFLDYETQDKIALNPYKRAHMYLIDNPGLCSTARDILWNKPGYVNKFDIISMGHYKDNPEKYEDLYDNHAASAFNRNSSYRVFRAFLGGYGYASIGFGRLPGPTATPTSVLDKLYHDRIVDGRRRDWPHDYYTSSMARAMAEHPNTSTETVVKLSCSHRNPEVRNIALKELGRRG